LPRWMSSAANLLASAPCIPGTETRPGRACSPTSGVTCCTTASSSGGYPEVKRGCRRRRSPSSAPLAGIPSGRTADLDDRAGRRRCRGRASRSPHRRPELTVDLQLKGHRALVTGSSDGTGEAVADSRLAGRYRLCGAGVEFSGRAAARTWPALAHARQSALTASRPNTTSKPASLLQTSRGGRQSRWQNLDLRSWPVGDTARNLRPQDQTDAQWRSPATRHRRHPDRSERDGGRQLRVAMGAVAGRMAKSGQPSQRSALGQPPTQSGGYCACYRTANHAPRSA
jgi:hypothetical protein